MKILYCNPSYYKPTVYLPYVFFKLKQQVKNAEFCEPLIDGAESFDVPYSDFVLLSCYVWNIERNVEIARKAKLINPNVIIIAGGPHVPLNEDPFQIYPEFDYVCTTEIENVLPHLFENLKTPGIRSRDFDLRFSSKSQLNQLESPWISQREDVLEMAASLKANGINPAFLWETNRGCPYKCTFCDWGSATNSKIRRFDHDTLLQELDIFAEATAEMIYIADANFGIFKNELEYIQKICDLKEKTGYPKTAFFSSAKNNKAVVNQSYALLHKAGLLQTAHIAFQHTDDYVLDAMDRSNIKNEKLIDEMKEAYHLGVPLVGMLVLGNPGDTLEKWKKSYYDLFELGFHDDIKTQDFMILPNAPASDPVYVDKWKIKTIERYHIDNPYFNRNIAGVPKVKYISSTISFNEDEYCEMQVFNSFILASHIFGATKFIALYLKFAHGMSYSEFYDTLWSNEDIQNILYPIRKAFKKYISGEKGIKLIDRTGPDIKTFELLIENHEKVLSVCDNIMSRFEDGLIIEDVIEFQKNILIKWEDQDFNVHYNLEEFFRKCLTLAPDEKIDSFEFKLDNKKYKKDDTYYRNVYLDEIVPKPINKLAWRKVFKRSNMRFRNTYKASIIFDEKSGKVVS